MNSEALFLFLVLLLGLVLCSFLGGNCYKEGFNAYTDRTNEDISGNHGNGYEDEDGNGHATVMYNSSYDNYNHYNGSSSELPSGTIYNGPNGGYVVVTTDNNGKQKLKVILMNGGSPVILSPSSNNNNNNSTNNSTSSTTTYYNSNGHNGSVTKFYGPNGFSATIVKIDGRKAIKITTKDKTIIFKEQGSNSNSNSNSNLNSNNYNNHNNNNNYNNDSISSSQYYGSTGNRIQTNNESDNQSNSTNYGGPYGGSVDNYHGPRTSNVKSHFDPYDSALPPGIPGSQIPIGDEHLYILKSEVIPPVCPVCPSNCNSTRKEPCPACPPCGRCPEPSFECKKVPNYNAINDSYLPVPVLNDFSSFGM